MGLLSVAIWLPIAFGTILLAVVGSKSFPGGLGDFEMGKQLVTQFLASVYTIIVANTGRWSPPASPDSNGTGVGLNNVRERLALTYPGRHDVEIQEVDGWVRVCLRLPARERIGTETRVSGAAGG